jgi:hypothetical protein
LSARRDAQLALALCGLSNQNSLLQPAQPSQVRESPHPRTASHEGHSRKSPQMGYGLAEIFLPILLHDRTCASDPDPLVALRLGAARRHVHFDHCLVPAHGLPCSQLCNARAWGRSVRLMIRQPPGLVGYRGKGPSWATGQYPSPVFASEMPAAWETAREKPRLVQPTRS